MERGEDLLATEGLFRVALLVHLNPKLVRLVDTLRRHRDVADDDVGALVPRNLAFRFHHSVFIRTVAQNFESDLVVVRVVDGEDSLVRRRIVLEELDRRGKHEHGRDPRLLRLRR